MMPGLPQSASQPGFAAFLSNIGQAPASGTGEDGGFSQLLVLAPHQVQGNAHVQIRREHAAQLAAVDLPLHG